MPAYADPEKLRQFASQLKSYNEFIETLMSSLRDDTKRLGQSWKDDQFDEFEAILERTRNLLVTFTMETRQAIELINRDAQALDEVRRVRPAE